MLWAILSNRVGCQHQYVTGLMGKMTILTRRQALCIGGAAVAAAAWHWDAQATPWGPRSPVDFAVPAGACDCHVHIVGDPARFPMAADRVYTPPQALPDMLLELQRDLHLDRVVLIQPSFYGTDNAAMLDALGTLGGRARGVAVVGAGASTADLDAMAKAGVRGLRINLETAGEFDPAVAARKLDAAVALCRPRGWHIQLYTRLSVIAALADMLAELPVPLVLDHFAGAQAAQGRNQPGFDAAIALVRSGKAYVKISAAYRASKAPAPYEDIAPLALALVSANPDRVIWGSDWPHTDSTRLPGRAATDISPFLRIDDGLMLNQLARWVPDAALRQKILAENPARLYGF
jgi:predicted TIM-barrel fold metal-dependent hydrolase